MAISINFEGWIQDRKDFDWGTVLKISHDQRAKNPATGEWETVGKDYFDVTVTTDQLHLIGDAKLVAVAGTLRKVDTFAKKDGSTGVALKVKALELTPVQRGQKVAASAPEIPSSWTASAPF